MSFLLNLTRCCKERAAWLQMKVFTAAQLPFQPLKDRASSCLVQVNWPLGGFLGALPTYLLPWQVARQHLWSNLPNCRMKLFMMIMKQRRLQTGWLDRKLRDSLESSHAWQWPLRFVSQPYPGRTTGDAFPPLLWFRAVRLWRCLSVWMERDWFQRLQGKLPACLHRTFPDKSAETTEVESWFLLLSFSLLHTVLMYRGEALEDFTGPDCRFVNFKKGDPVYVYYKLAGGSPEVWAGSVSTALACFIFFLFIGLFNTLDWSNLFSGGLGWR